MISERKQHKSQFTPTKKQSNVMLPHSVYAVEERVLVKTNKKKWNKVNGKGVATRRSSKATVVAVNATFNKYKVKVDNCPSTTRVSVTTLTSLTRDKERKGVKVSGMYDILCCLEDHILTNPPDFAGLSRVLGVNPGFNLDICP